ncbi:MAG TPA: tripartite tricarboxylate transporter substrate binding protein [Xanthobacteraceae bacterium]|nr:tripartite tricarboxylate transporter substrate binding protein [Xanthobacteraceae bacterium]
MLRISRRMLLTATALSLMVAPALGQDYPAKPVRIIVPFNAGGPTDVTARLVAEGLSKRLGKQFYVENVTGAGGNIGTGQAARATPDGYTLLVASTGFMVNPSLYASVPYDPKKDFAPLTLVAASPNVLAVNPSVPAKTVQELVTEIRAHPDKYSFAQPATGSTPHLAGEMFKLHFKLDKYTMIPFTGAAPAVASTVAGHTPTVWSALPPSLTAIQAGQLRAIAVTSAKRVEVLPDVPTMEESGVPDQESETLTSMFVPAGTPKPIIDKLYKEIAAIVHSQEVKEKLKSLGFVPVGNPPEEWGKRVDAEITKWARVIKEAKIPQIK